MPFVPKRVRIPEGLNGDISALGATTATGIDPTYGVGAPITTGAGRTLTMVEAERERRRALEGVANPSEQYILQRPQRPQTPQTSEGVSGFGIIDTTLKTLGGSAPGTFESLGGRVDDKLERMAANRAANRAGLSNMLGVARDMFSGLSPSAIGQQQQKELRRKQGLEDTFYSGRPDDTLRKEKISPWGARKLRKYETDIIDVQQRKFLEKERKFLEKQGLEDTHYSGVPDDIVNRSGSIGVVGAARDTITDITGAPRRAKNIIDDLFF
jgi:hypothetical protein